MNGPIQGLNTTYSSEKYSECKTFGLNSSKSKNTPFLSLLSRVAFGFVASGGDAAVKLASWQYIYGGTNSPQEYADANTFKHLTCAIMAVTPFAYSGVPFENARRAYYADKTWPLELRKGYTSPTNALLRIPF
jgi:hypothetical protein